LSTSTWIPCPLTTVLITLFSALATVLRTLASSASWELGRFSSRMSNYQLWQFHDVSYSTYLCSAVQAFDGWARRNKQIRAKHLQPAHNPLLSGNQVFQVINKAGWPSFPCGEALQVMSPSTTIFLSPGSSVPRAPCAIIPSTRVVSLAILNCG